MAMPRKLSQEQERNLTLAYLCGVSESYINKNWNVSEATITNIINRSKDLKNPLIEFYRQTKHRTGKKNSAHVYLCGNGVNLPNSELLNCKYENFDEINTPDIFCAVWEDIYDPLIERVIKTTSIINDIISPNNPLERIIADARINKTATLDSIKDYCIKPVLKDKLYEEYNKERFSLDDVYDNVKNVLLNKIKNGAFGLSPRKVDIFSDAFNKLTEMQKDVLSSYYGIFGREKRTPKDISKDYGLTRNRIVQIKDKALRRVRQVIPEDVRKIYGQTEKETAETLAEYERKERKKQDERREGIEQISRLEIKDFNLREKEEKILAKNGINTVVDLVSKTKDELMQYEGFGKKSLVKIETELKRYRASLKN